MTQKIIFSGRVQGVGFRYETKEIALGFDIIGTVKNLPDGTVELLIEGEKEEVEDFLIEIIEESTLSHHIQEVTRRNIAPLENVKGFTISTGN